MKVAIYGKSFSPDFNDSIKFLFDKLFKNKSEIYIYKPYFDYILKNIPDIKMDIAGFYTGYTEINGNMNFMLSIGGDGTFLEAVTFIRNSGIPIVGLNSGRLGFLANISKENLGKAITDIFEDNYQIEKRKLIQVSSELDLFDNYHYALNEFTIHKKDSSSMITIQAFINNEHLNTYWVDGLIVATPTGSTAYSMSAGGPIVTPDSENFIISPLAPHNLSVRPVVIPDKYELKVRVEGRNINYLVSLDHRNEVIDRSIDFCIKSADFYINSIRLPFNDFFTTLRTKLMWGIDKRN